MAQGGVLRNDLSTRNLCHAVVSKFICSRGEADAWLARLTVPKGDWERHFDIDWLLPDEQHQIGALLLESFLKFLTDRR
jgi:hypothetical protein